MALTYAKQKATAILDGDDANTAFAERSRQNDGSIAFGHWPLGGSRHVGISGTGVQDIPDYQDIRVDASQETLTNGYVMTARVEILTLEAGTTVEPMIYDVTTAGSPTLVTTTGGSASSGTSWARQSLTFPAHASGVKFYRLRVSKSNANALVLAVGTIERSVP